MGKLLFWVVVIIAVLLIARVLARQAARRNAPPAPAAPSSQRAVPTSPMMTRCAHCGIHLPRAEAVMINGQTWCSEEHAKAGARPLN